MYNWNERLSRYLAPFLNRDDPVVQTIVGGFATQWEQVESDWDAANAVWSVLGASGDALTREAGYMGLNRLPNESDDHLLQRMANVLNQRPTQSAVAKSIALLSLNEEAPSVYQPFGGALVEWDPAASFRFDRQTADATLTRSSTAWDPFTQSIVGNNTPTFVSVNTVPDAPNTVQTGVGVWEEATNLWPNSTWEGATTLTSICTPSTTNPAYWTVQSGVMPAAVSGTWSGTAPVVMTTGPNFVPTLIVSGTLTVNGNAGLLWGFQNGAGYIAGITGTTIYLGTASTASGPVIVQSGTLTTANAVQLSVEWTTNGQHTLTWNDGTQSGTLTMTNTSQSQGSVGFALWSGSATYTPGSVQGIFPANLTLTLSDGPAVQMLTGTQAQMPAPGMAIQWWDIGSGTTSIAGLPTTLSQSGTWSWWGESFYTTGTGSYSAGTYTNSWASATWGTQALTVPAGTYTPTWSWTGTGGTAYIGMPQWEATAYSTPYIPNTTTGTTSRAAELLQFPALAHNQNQGMIGLGLWGSTALNAQSGTVWSYQSGTNGLTVAFDGTQWISTWKSPSGSFQSTWTGTLAPNQWHYGLWQWGPLGWQWGWDGIVQSGTTTVPWSGGTYQLTVYPNGYVTNLTVSDGVLPASETSQWAYNLLTPLFATTVAQANWIGEALTLTQGQSAGGYAYSLGTAVSTIAPYPDTTMVLDVEPLDESSLAGTTSSSIPVPILQQALQALIPAGTWLFPWQRGNLQ